jgi:cell division protein FtsW
MAVTVNIVPVTGVTLPLISMGGSSFIFTCCSIGLILSVARNVEQLEGKAPVETEIEIPAEDHADSNNSNNPMVPTNA